MAKQKVFAWSDIHAPFQDKKSIEIAFEIMEKEKPSVIINLGDIVDRLSFGRFARSQDEMTPKEELEEAREFCLEYWAKIHKLCPRARKIQLLGNHCRRVLRSTIERFPEIYSLVQNSEKEYFSYKNVETIQDHRSELSIDGVVYTHGWASKIGDHARHLGKSVVRAHSHRLEIVWMNLGGKPTFEMACGFLADEKKRALQYTPTMTTHWTKGVGIIDKGVPRPVPIIK